MKNPLLKLKEVFHFCSNFKWSRGYGPTPLGRGTYDFEYCEQCRTPTGKIKNFTAEMFME